MIEWLLWVVDLTDHDQQPSPSQPAQAVKRRNSMANQFVAIFMPPGSKL